MTLRFGLTPGKAGFMRLHPIIAMVALLALSQSAMGQGRPNLDANAILAQQQDIRGEANARKGRYKDMKEAARQELFAKQEVVRNLLQKNLHHRFA